METRRSAEPLSLLVWYTISSGSDEPLNMERDQLCQLLAEAGLEEELLPPENRRIDSFRAATSTLRDQYEVLDVASATMVKVRLAVREVGTTPGYVMRRMFRTCVDPSGETAERRVADLQFFRPRRMSAGRITGTERLRVLVDRRLRGVDRERVTALVEQAEQLYAALHARLSPHAMREVVRSFLRSRGAVVTAGTTGGAYLAPAECEGDLRKMQAIVRACGGNCRMWIFPMPHEADLHALLVMSIDQDIQTRAEQLRREIGAWVGKHPRRTPTTRLWASWQSETRSMQDLLVEFMDRHDAMFPCAAASLDELVELTEDLRLRPTEAPAPATPGRRRPST